MNIGCDNRAEWVCCGKSWRRTDCWMTVQRRDPIRLCYVSDSHSSSRARLVNNASVVSRQFPVLGAKNVHPPKSTVGESPATFLLAIPQLLPSPPPAAQHPLQPLKLLLLYSSRLELGSFCGLGQLLLRLSHKKTETIKLEHIFVWRA